MTANTLPADYANGIIYDLEKAFWDERGRGCRFRTTMVGRQFLLERCLPQIETTGIEPWRPAPAISCWSSLTSGPLYATGDHEQVIDTVFPSKPGDVTQ